MRARGGTSSREGVVLRKLALVLHHGGAAAQGIEYVKQAIKLFEQFGSANTLRRTYDAAARMLPDRRMARFARESKAAMTARAALSSSGGSQDFLRRAKGARHTARGGPSEISRTTEHRAPVDPVRLTPYVRNLRKNEIRKPGTSVIASYLLAYRQRRAYVELGGDAKSIQDEPVPLP